MFNHIDKIYDHDGFKPLKDRNGNGSMYDLDRLAIDLIRTESYEAFLENTVRWTDARVRLWA